MGKNNEYDIESIQEALTICGFNPGEIDGVMGPNTISAIKAFQKEMELDVDGIVGSDTAQALAESLNEASVRAAELEGYFSGDGSSADEDM